AIRLPTLIAILLTTLLIYGYARNYLSRLGATAGAVAYATMGQVLQIGRLAESEGVFTLFIAASLLVWHWGYLKRWPMWVAWSAGYGLAALAGLTKGPQGPIYFVVPVTCYLLWRRDRRWLLSRGHAAGIATFAVVLASWQVPYALQTNMESVATIWTKQASNRFSAGLMPLLIHMLKYPLHVLACMLPWSLALMHLFNRRFQAATREIRAELTFLAFCLVTTFPSVWLAVGAEPRYFMPLYPIVAVVCGIVIDRSIGRQMGGLNLGWKTYLVGCGVVVVAAAVAFVGARHLPGQLADEFRQPVWFSVVYAIFAVLVCWFLVGTVRSPLRVRHQAAVLAIGVALGLSYAGAVINSKSRRERSVTAAVARAKRSLPADVSLVSFGKIDHAFLYHYGNPIRRLDWPAPGDARDFEYFCFSARDRDRHRLPFAWTQVALVSLRNSPEPPSGNEGVVIGRRLAIPQTATATRDDRN
ncbi:MAG: ArnT family glycosyltransferase, partial [Planctomycetaceae bacterium]